MLSATLKCLDLGIPPPMGLFLAYSAILVNFTVSPSRLLGVMDPIIPSSFLVHCLKGKSAASILCNKKNVFARVCDWKSFLFNLSCNRDRIKL